MWVSVTSELRSLIFLEPRTCIFSCSSQFLPLHIHPSWKPMVNWNHWYHSCKPSFIIIPLLNYTCFFLHATLCTPRLVFCRKHAVRTVVRMVVPLEGVLMLLCTVHPLLWEFCKFRKGSLGFLPAPTCRFFFFFLQYLPLFRTWHFNPNPSLVE